MYKQWTKPQLGQVSDKVEQLLTVKLGGRYIAVYCKVLSALLHVQ
jgi:hypothetical protein